MIWTRRVSEPAASRDGRRLQASQGVSAASRDQASRAETASATVLYETVLGTVMQSSSAEDLPPGVAVLVFDRRPLPFDIQEDDEQLTTRWCPGPPPPAWAPNDPGLD